MRNNASYYRNAGMEPPKKKSIVQKSLDVASSALAFPQVAKEKVRGMGADIKRGQLLYKQGYGEYYDSALKIAKAGKSAGKKRKAK